MKRLFCIIASYSLAALSHLSPVVGQEYIRVADRDKRGNDVVVYRDAVTGVAERAWHQQRLVLSAFDSSLATREGSFIGMRAVNEARIERIIPKILRYYDRLLNIDPAEFVKRQIETDGNKWYITFKQMHNGVPVYRAEVGLTIDEFGQIISIGANSIPNMAVSTSPSLSEAEAISVALREMTTFADDSLSIRSKPELIIYPKRSETEVKSYLAYQVDAVNHTNYAGERIFVDAHSGTIIEKASLFRHGNKTIQGNISGRYWPKDLNSAQTTDFPKYYQQLTVTNILGQTVGTGYIDINGNYSITWNGSVGTYRLQIALKGTYAQVTNVPNTTLSFVVSGTTTYNRQFSADQEAYNLYFHMNKIHDWFKAGPFNYNGMDYRMLGAAYAGSGVNGVADGTNISFGTQNGKLWHSQSDGIYHEYTHNVVYHIYGNWIDPNDQKNSEGFAMDEGIPDYFACSLADDPLRPLVQRNVATPDLRYPQDFDFSNQTADPHQNGLILAGACWDLQKDGGVSQSDARKLAFKAMQLTPRPNTFQEFVDNVILQDDNNGTLCDGTPHSTQIINAFETKHGISPTILPPPLTVSITGPNSISPGVGGTWSANVCGGSGTIIYQWSVRYDGSSTFTNLGASQNQSLTFPDDCTINDLKVDVIRGGQSAQDLQTVIVSNGPIFCKRAVDDVAQIPDKFALHQNFPNPFNPETEIRFDLPEEAHVQVVIFDLLGREVRKLIDKNIAPGYHSVVWDGRDNSGQTAASGVYLYQMSAGNFREVKKLTLVR